MSLSAVCLSRSVCLSDRLSLCLCLCLSVSVCCLSLSLSLSPCLGLSRVSLSSYAPSAACSNISPTRLLGALPEPPFSDADKVMSSATPPFFRAIGPLRRRFLTAPIAVVVVGLTLSAADIGACISFSPLGSRYHPFFLNDHHPLQTSFNEVNAATCPRFVAHFLIAPNYNQTIKVPL